MRASRRLGAAAASMAAALAAYAAFGSGLDRISRGDPQAAPRVPDDFRSNAWRSLSARALAERRLAEATAAAEAAVAADPADPAAASALGLARLNAGDGAGAEAAFRVAGRLGWRDLPTQIYWLGVAAEVGDHAAAAERADAILRQNVALLEQPRLLAALEATPGGRRALAARLATRPPWFAEYLDRTFTLSPDDLAARARVLEEPALRAAAIACGEVRGLGRALVERDRAAQGRRLLGRFCGADGGSRLRDGGFERARLDQAAGDGWRFAGAGGLEVRLTDASAVGGRAAVVDSRLPFRTVFASQALALAPGRYRIGWRARDAAGRASGRIAVRLACSPGVGGFPAATAAGGDRFTTLAEVRAERASQTLELAILPGSGSVTIDDVALAPIG
ncbi:MAG: hypothetical protein LC648_05065 [Novosphingobium sp.]|nr:hypothetical protein [Novosphingobium sp.]